MPAQLIIGNSYSKIIGLTPKEFNSLKKLMSYRPPYNHFSPMANRAISLLDKKGNFPTGLLYIVQKWLRDSNGVGPLPHVIRTAHKDTRIKPKFTNKARFGLPKFDCIPDAEQMAAATVAANKERGIISAVTGYGKSIIAGLIVHTLQVRTLIVVPSVELKTQLSESMAKWFGANKVGPGKDIWIENVQALSTKKPVVSYDCVLIDEFHHSGAKSYRKLNKNCWSNIYYRFGLTATPFRSDETERLLLESVLSEVIYKISYQTGVKNGRIVPVEAYYVELPKVDTEAYTWKEVYSELVVNNEARNLIINQLAFKLALNAKSTLCLVKEIAHGNRLAIKNFVHGQDQDSRDLIKRFNTGEVSILTGTTGILGEGVDTKPAEYIIIAGLGKSKNQFMQQVGRGLRAYKDKQSCKVIIFLDKSHKFCVQHFRAQVKILKDEYGVTPIKLDL